jgi:hypothetical protein
MPEITTCPECDKKLKVPDNLIGKQVRCPGCSVMFTARPDDAEEPAPRPKSREAARSDRYSERRAPERDDDRPRSRSRDDRDEEDRYSERHAPRARPRDEYDEDHPRRRNDYEDDRPRRRDDYDDDDYDRRPRRSDVAKGWRMTRLGLFLVIIANWVFLGGIGIAIIGGGILLLTGASMFSSFAGSPPTNQAAAQRAAAGMAGTAIMTMLVFGLVGLVMFGAAILQLVGQGICMMVPSKRGSALRGLAIAAFACACAAYVIGTGVYLVRMRGSGSSINGLLSTASFVCWVLFLRLVAQECRESEVGQRLIICMISFFVLGFLGVILIIIAACGGAMAIGQAAQSNSNPFAAAGAMLIVMVIVMGLLGLVGLGLFVWYTLLMQQVRTGMDRLLSRL